MAKRKPKYSTTRAGIEAAAEDLASDVNSRLEHDGPQQYNELYDQTKARLARGESADEIRKVLNRPAEKIDKILPNGRPPSWQEGHNRAEKQFERIRSCAIEDALAGRPRQH